MPEKKIDAPAEPASKKRYNAAETPRPVMSFRVNADLHNRMKASVEKNGYALTEEIERRLTRSFDLEDRVAELERHIDMMKETERLLWPDAEARALGRAFAMALAAARHVGGQGWREDPSVPLVVAGAVRRLMDRVTRDGGSLYAGLAVDPARAAAAADNIARVVGPALDEAMPPLPEPSFDVMQWTGRVRLETEFRDAATGEVLETVAGPECDVADPEQRPARGEGYRSALARFAPMREAVEAEDFEVYVMKDGAAKRVSLDLTPAGLASQPTAKPTPDGTRWATPGELAEMKPARGILPSSIGDRALLDDAAAGLPLEKAERAAEAKLIGGRAIDLGPEPAPAPKRRGRPKVTA